MVPKWVVLARLLVELILYSHGKGRYIPALDEVVTNEATVKLGAEGRLGKSGESGHTASSGGGLGRTGRGAGVLAGRSDRSSRRADVLVLGDGLGNAGGEGHGGDDVAEGRHFCWFGGGNN